MLQQPLVILAPNSKLSGCLHLVAHERQSYDIHLELEAPPIGPGMPAQKVRGWNSKKKEREWNWKTPKHINLPVASFSSV